LFHFTHTHTHTHTFYLVIYLLKSTLDVFYSVEQKKKLYVQQESNIQTFINIQKEYATNTIIFNVRDNKFFIHNRRIRKFLYKLYFVGNLYGIRVTPQAYLYKISIKPS